jgi:hypothetical protein
VRYGPGVFRDDRQAMALQNDDLRREVNHLRRENAALREAIIGSVPSAGPLAHRGLYRNHPLALNEAERIALGTHQLEHFPVWLAVLLHIATFGLFSVLYYASQGGRLPEIEPGDPNAQKAVGFFFIPYFNLYWLFAFPTRLADRINLQLRLRGEAPAVSQALMVACAIRTPLIVVPFFWIFAVVQLQQAINRIVALGPVAPARAAPAVAFDAERTGVRVEAPAFADADPAYPQAVDEAAWQAEAVERARR